MEGIIEEACLNCKKLLLVKAASVILEALCV